jgi:hypothetical protein
VSFLAGTAHEGEIYTKYNHGTLPLSSPRLIFSFRNLSYCPRSITTVYPPIRFSSASYVVFFIVAPAFTFPFVSFTSRMGRRCTAEDYQRTAEENDWDLEAHEEEDSVQ